MARLWEQKAVCWKLLDVWKTRAEFGNECSATSNVCTGLQNKNAAWSSLRWQIWRKIWSLDFLFTHLLLSLFLIVFLTKLYWHFLEPKLANKYNEMLKRTLNQIQYSSQNVCDQETMLWRLCRSQLKRAWGYLFQEIRGDVTSLGGTRAAAKNKASKYEMLPKKWRWTCTGYVPGLQSVSMWLLTVLIYHVENQTTISH